ncbi:hypothetical protein CSPX01_12089 [Colletotrichum filicis]|nr:hypothetical protein CSPX01_12089 [Colletotrichum filicis]
MMEIGLTDTFIMHAQMEYSSQGKDAFFEWSNDENETGSKVAKTTEDGTYADFFYESAKTIGRVKVQDYQNILLAKYAKENGFEAYIRKYEPPVAIHNHDRTAPPANPSNITRRQLASNGPRPRFGEVYPKSVSPAPACHYIRLNRMLRKCQFRYVSRQQEIAAYRTFAAEREAGEDLDECSGSAVLASSALSGVFMGLTQARRSAGSFISLLVLSTYTLSRIEPLLLSEYDCVVKTLMLWHMVKIL